MAAATVIAPAPAPPQPHMGDIEQGRISHYSDDNDEEECSSTVLEKKSAGWHTEKEKNRTSSSSSYSSCCLSECSVEDHGVDPESGGGRGGGDGGGAVVVENKVNMQKVKRDCRICHLSLDGSNPDSGFPIELGCSCKGDLAAAHKHCAEVWFKIRGNKTCEICGSTAHNVVGVNEVELMEQWNEANDTAPPAPIPPHQAETQHFWQGHRFLNFLLACMVFAFVISWLFHFNVPS